MTLQQKRLIRHTWAALSRTDEKAVGAAFFDRLFYIAPEVRALFLSSAANQAKKLMALLHYMVRNVDQPEEVGFTVSALATRHVGHRIKPYQYTVVGNALLWTLEKMVGDAWSDETEDAWADYYTALSEIMTGAHRLHKAVA